tara:strand:+ start:794 stop:1030 length:237 start_codon:yes stop_codon:yes gene_type:complete
MSNIKQEMDKVIQELESKGINHTTTEQQVVGLGDIVESSLQKFGITQDRFKSWFGLQECNCTKRKKYLNNLFNWKVNK